MVFNRRKNHDNDIDNASDAGSNTDSNKKDKKSKSRKPPNTAFRQQRLLAYAPILTPKTVLPLFFAVGIIFGPIGGLLLYASSKVPTSYNRAWMLWARRVGTKLTGRCKRLLLTTPTAPKPPTRTTSPPFPPNSSPPPSPTQTPLPRQNHNGKPLKLKVSLDLLKMYVKFDLLFPRILRPRLCYITD